MTRAWSYSLIVFLLILAAGALGYFVGVNRTVTPGEQQAQGGTGFFSERDLVKGVEVVTLSAQNDSGQRGFALLSEDNGKVKVSIRTVGEPDGSKQPVHIHMGACPTPGEVLFPLNTLENGDSETELSTTIGQLKAQGQLAINAHKSDEEIGTYVACGNIDF